MLRLEIGTNVGSYTDSHEFSTIGSVRKYCAQVFNASDLVYLTFLHAIGDGKETTIPLPRKGK